MKHFLLLKFYLLAHTVLVLNSIALPAQNSAGADVFMAINSRNPDMLKKALKKVDQFHQ